MTNLDLIKKYNTQAPRYTSYPTVPFWDNKISIEEWINTIKKSFAESNDDNGLSIYIHLPFCESLCTYCGCNTRITVNHAVELTYVNAVLDEWKIYFGLFKKKPLIKEIHLGGGTPTFFSAQHLKLLVNSIKDTAVVHPEAEFSFEAHPANTTLEHLTTLYQIGFRRLSLGIQDFDPRVQETINRNQSFDQVKKITEDARKIGYTSINYDLIYGLPLQTVKSVKSTINKIVALRPDRLAFYSYAHVPWIKPGQRKFTENDLPVDALKRKIYETGRDMFTEVGYEEIGMDHFSLKTDTLYKAQQNQSLHRNFMGYTHNYTQLMVGLGVSSISDSMYAFAQNVKTVEEYLEKIKNKELPIFRGHLLTKEDLIIRKHIVNLMCNLHTTWYHPSEQCDAILNLPSLLQEPIADELIKLNSNELHITKKGKAFMRNICMAFDSRLIKNSPTTNLFSSSI